MAGFTLQQLQAMGAQPVQAPTSQPTQGFTLQQLQAMGAKPVVQKTPLQNAADYVGGTIKNAFESGVNQIKEGEQQGSTANDPISLLESGTKIAAGAINTITSPLAPITAPIGTAINAVGDKIGDIPAVQKFAESKAGQVTNRVAEDVSNVSTIAQGAAGSMETPEIAGAVGDKVASTAGKVVDTVGGAVDKIAPDQVTAINQLEGDYEKWTGATKPGVKSLNQAEARTTALDNSGTTGKLPQRVLAESGVIPETTGTKFTTSAQAQTYRANIAPLAEAADKAVDEISYMTPKVPIDTLQNQTIARIKNLGLTASDEKSMVTDAQNEYSLWKEKYGDSMSLSDLKDEKSTYQKPVKFDSTKPFKSDFNYQIAKTAQTTIEKTAQDAGFPEVAQLNREIGDRYAAAKMLEKLDGQTLKYGKIGKYAMGVAGAALGKTIPGKILGYMGGEAVADMLMKSDVANPIKRLILKSIQEKDPVAYTATIKWLNEQDVLRNNRALLPAGKTIPLGSEGNPIITPNTQGTPNLNAQPAVGGMTQRIAPDMQPRNLYPGEVPLLGDGKGRVPNDKVITPSAPTTFEKAAENSKTTTVNKKTGDQYIRDLKTGKLKIIPKKK